MIKTKIKRLFLEKPFEKIVRVTGWVKNIRKQKNFTFLSLSDGSCFSHLQVILDPSLENYEKVSTLSIGSSLEIQGKIVESKGKEQVLEMQAKSVIVFGECSSEEYPLQKKQHSFEFLRTIAHLRPRTNTQGAVTRIRNALAYATHKFFQERDFLYLHAPILTGSDCEGGGAMFQVTALDFDHLSQTLTNGKIDFSKDFFRRKAFLTVSGQLNAEVFACGLGDVYTFGPTFRAENSNTSRHLAEFWMIEPEMAFANLKDNMDIAEKYVKAMIEYILTHNIDDMKFFDTFIEKGLIARLEHVLKSEFAHMTYTEAITLLQKSSQNFVYPVQWGSDLQSEHERYITEHIMKKPVVVTGYPKEIKAFYMRANEDGKTVAAMDVLVPKIGEIIGGSQREERFDVLKQKITSMGLKEEDYWWYLELRKYGTVPHSGFGLGFERLILFVTGMENIRDVIPFPRYPGHIDF